MTGMSNAVTQGIRVSVTSAYMPAHSDPDQEHYAFAYTVVIENEGERAAKLESRHWIITDALGQIEEVQGPGVIGETPRLEPGQTHEYQSFCVLRTPRGTMHGSYRMVRDDASSFDAEIGAFVLTTSTESAEQFLN